MRRLQFDSFISAITSLSLPSQCGTPPATTSMKSLMSNSSFACLPDLLDIQDQGIVVQADICLYLDDGLFLEHCGHHHGIVPEISLDLSGPVMKIKLQVSCSCSCSFSASWTPKRKRWSPDHWPGYPSSMIFMVYFPSVAAL